MSLNELLDVVFRWAHLNAGIMWIGNSMLFNWLDRNLEKQGHQLGRLSQGKIYMVHSGAFYEAEKTLLEPGALPKNLYWFKWQNGITWMTGIALLVVVYYMNGTAFLVDPSRHDTAPVVAITMSLGSLFVGWLIYDALWRVLGESRPQLATACSIVMLFGSAYLYSLFFSGRATYIHTGVLMGTIMTGNVWFCIMPSQRSLIASTKSGKDQDPLLSLRAKQRSIHNNYLTFPLLFIMVSTHFSSAVSAYLNWLVLIVVMVGGAGIRHFMNVRYRGEGLQLSTRAWLGPALVMAALTIVGVLVITRVAAPRKLTVDQPVPFRRVQEILGNRCMVCHSAKPTDAVFRAPPAGVVFDNPQQIQIYAPRIKYRTYEVQNMPFNNQTDITDRERAELARWVDDGAKLD
ncbi:MAG: urate hydroxylase PuuD [Deltaproteobacteria bacterium]|nr:urate hydroxylase PuuD [Deltaproteobacteria bacterium]